MLPSQPRPQKTLLAWSGGKDCAWALYVLRRDPLIEVVGLLTVLNAANQRVAMHAVRESLLDSQSAALGLPLWKIPVPDPCPSEAYADAMGRAMEEAGSAGITAVAFGDLFLENVRHYREERLAHLDIAPIFPLWGRDTASLACDMIRSGLRAIVTCVDTSQLDASFVGRFYDEKFLIDLPDGVDPCGERGEFHTLVFSGPMLSETLPVTIGEVVERDGFVRADVRAAVG